MNTRLLNSFGAVYRLLERPRVARGVLVGLLVIHTLLLGYSAYVHSPTLNEPAHLVAALSHWKFGRFELYRVNPPLVKMVAALPVMAAGYNEDWSGFYEGPGARPEMGMGENFVAANGERSFFLFMIARWACIPFSWLGMIVCFLWARDLYGRPAGVMAATIWCFEPNILAHAALITPDAGATALGLAACYTFWRWLKNPTWTQAALTGVVLGLAELAKTTLILFYPLWPLMWLVYRWSEHREARSVAVSLRETNPHAEREDHTGTTPRSLLSAPRWLVREAGMLALRMAIGLYILNLGYGFEGSFTKLKDFHFVSDLFAGKTSEVGGQRSDSLKSSPQSQTLSPQRVNRFSDTILAHVPVPFPKNYLLGIDIQQKDFEHYGRPSYLRGVWQDHGWWYYYLYACAIKVPLGLWALGFMALFLSLWENRGEREWLAANSQQLTAFPRDLFILLFPPLVIFIVVSSKTGFNEHMRYVLPTFPYFFIAISHLAHRFAYPALAPTPDTRYPTPNFRNLFSSLQQELSRRYLTTTRPSSYIRPTRSDLAAPTQTRRLRMAFLPATAVLACCSWFIASSMWLFPHDISYFNESIGGPLNGPSCLLGSNVDWGQDLRSLVDAVDSNAFGRRFLISHFGAFDLKEHWVQMRKSDVVQRSFTPVEQKVYCLAISINSLNKSFTVMFDNDGREYTASHLLLTDLQRLPPIGRIGYSILIISIDAHDLGELRQ